MDKILLIDQNKCTGCGACMLACAFSHEGKFNSENSRLWVERFEDAGEFAPTICTSCGHRPCIDACPVDAIKYDEELETPIIDRDTCTGCGNCVEACPYGGIRLVEDEALKCDLCGGEPECVKACMTDAIQFVEKNKENIRKKTELTLERTERVESEKDTYDEEVKNV